MHFFFKDNVTFDYQETVPEVSTYKRKNLELYDVLNINKGNYKWLCYINN